MRYKIVEGSQSGSHGFEYSVIDSNKPETTYEGVHIVTSGGQPLFAQICECFYKEDAETICNALNEVGK